MANPTHKLYLDDSGNKDFRPDRQYSRDTGQSPYFVFAGLLASMQSVQAIDRATNAAKMAAFGRTDVEIKSHWLRHPEQQKKRYLDPFGVSNQSLTAFTDAVYSVIADADCELIGCVVNKAEVQEKYPNPFYPPAIAYDCVLQRVQQAMIEADGSAHVTIDDMTGKSPKGREWKANLIAQHKHLRTRGSAMRKNFAFDRIEGAAPTFRDSAIDNCVQLSDLVAYCIYRQFVDHGPEWEQREKSLPLYQYMDKIVRKFRQGPNGRVQGYGIVKFPMNLRVRWVVSDKPKNEGRG